MAPKRARQVLSSEDSDELSVDVAEESHEEAEAVEKESNDTGVTNLDDQISMELHSVQKKLNFYYDNQLVLIPEPMNEFWRILKQEVGADALETLKSSFKGTPLETFADSEKKLSNMTSQELFYYMLKTYCGIYNKEGGRVKTYELFISLWFKLYSFDVCMGTEIPLCIAASSLMRVTRTIRNSDKDVATWYDGRLELEDNPFAVDMELIINHVNKVPDVVHETVYYIAWRAMFRLNQLLEEQHYSLTEDFLQGCVKAMGLDLDIHKNMKELDAIFQKLFLSVGCKSFHPFKLLHCEWSWFRFQDVNEFTLKIPDSWTFCIATYLGGFAKILLHSSTTQLRYNFTVDADIMARQIVNFALHSNDYDKSKRMTWNNDLHYRFLVSIAVTMLKVCGVHNDIPAISV